MVGIDQPQTRKCLKLSDAESWLAAELEPQKADGGDYWREANNLSSVCERASGTELGVIFVYLCKLKRTSPWVTGGSINFSFTQQIANADV